MIRIKKAAQFLNMQLHEQQMISKHLALHTHVQLYKTATLRLLALPFVDPS
jgi:hypothetical protein